MTIILVLIYIALTRIVMWIFDGTTIGWTFRFIIILAVNAGATLILFDYINDQFDPIRQVFINYYKRFD